jgi:hypothetical protein
VVGAGHERGADRPAGFSSEDRVRDVLHNFSADGLDSLYPRYAGGRPPVFTLAKQRNE